MAYFKVKTESGVKVNAPLSTRSDYQRAIKLLEQELSTLSTETATRPVKKVKREPSGTAEFLEGTSTK
ncbi:MAG: hypothetical protein PUG48_05630 [Clostridia bacterium]|nr:hypothetical protein [Clostridia bacterium]